MKRKQLERLFASSGRFDASESAFFARQLEHIRSGVFETAFPELKMNLLLPMNTEVNPGAEDFTYEAFSKVGTAELSSDYSTDGPRADVTGVDFTSKIRGIKASYGTNLQEMRAAQMAGLPLSMKKAVACRTAIEQKLDRVAFLGDADLGLSGLYTLADTEDYTVPNPGAGTEFENKTADQILTDLNGIVHGIVNASNEVEKPDTLLLPLSSFNLINTVRMPDGDSNTVMRFFLSTNEYITSIISHTRLETAGAAGVKRMVAYKRDSMKLEMIMPQMFEQLAPEIRGYETVTQCHARTGGVVAYWPKSIGYGDGI